MHTDSEIDIQDEALNVLNDMYVNILNTIKNGNNKKEEIPNGMEIYSNEFMTPPSNNSRIISGDSDEKIMNEVHSEFLLKMFEEFKEANKRIIDSLVDENFRLKSELRFSRVLLEMIKNRLDEVLFYSHRSYTEKVNNTSPLDKRRRSIYNSRKNSSNSLIRDKNISIEKIRKNPLNINNFDFDHTENYIINQINHLRVDVKSIKSKIIFKDKLIERFKNNMKESKRETFISKASKELDSKALTMSVPRWLPDYIVKNCLSCSKSFGFFVRKHHCRICGNIFCSNCCNNFTDFMPFYEGRVRACNECYKNKKNGFT